MSDIIDINIYPVVETISLTIEPNLTTINVNTISGGGGAVDSVNGQTGVVVLDIPTNTSDLVNDGEDGVHPYITLLDLPSNLILYPTTVASDISGYVKLVTDIHDIDYNTTAVDVSTGAITTINQLISSLITVPDLISGNPGVFNISTVGNIRRSAGSGTAEFYFNVYKRDSLGTETLIGVSNPTLPVNNGVYAEFNATAIWDDGVFTATDRIVLKFYGSRISGGSNPTYEFQFGGLTPVRTLVPIPLSVVPVLTIDATPTDGSTNAVSSNGVFDALALKQDTLVSATNIKTINGSSILGSGDLVVGGASSLTVGTSPITSGTIGRVFFQGTGNVLQQSASLFWDDTNSRLGVGATPTSTVRLDVRAQGALSTDVAFRVRNSANTANLLTVLGNNNIGIGIDNPLDRLHISTVAGSNNVLRMSSASGSANVITFRNADASIQGAFLASGSTFSYGTYISNQCNLTGGSGGLGFRVTNTANINLYGGNADADFGVNYFRFFGATGNIQIQNGGTYTEITSARLAVNSTTQGFLPPRMTTTEKNAIASPVAGLVVYDSTLNKLCVRTASAWETITSI